MLSDSEDLGLKMALFGLFSAKSAGLYITIACEK